MAFNKGKPPHGGSKVKAPQPAPKKGAAPKTAPMPKAGMKKSGRGC
jgi:hypothetical protein